VRRRVRVEVESSRIRNVTAGIIGNDRDIIPYLALVRIALEGIKRVAHRNIRRPGRTGIGTKGIEKLRVSVIRRVSRVIPDSIEPTIGGYCECTKPMPLVRINRIIIHFHRRAEC